MNITEESFHDGLNLRQYVWKKEWVRPYESTYSVVLNFCRVNVCNGKKAINILKQKYQKIQDINNKIPLRTKRKKNKGKFRDSIYDQLMPHWYWDQSDTFNSIFNGQQILNTEVYYCPECMKAGYHSYLHQIVNVKKCLFHNTDLICEKMTDYSSIKSIVYEYDMTSVNNARDLVHPELRENVNLIFPALGFNKSHEKMIHFVSMCDEFYSIVRSNIHAPRKFLINKEYDWHIHVKHDITSVEELICELINNEDLPGAIREYGQPFQPDGYFIPTMYYILIHYYLYCKSMNFVKEESKHDYSLRKVELEDVLYENDKVRLKYSFLWMIKDSMYTETILSTDWVYLGGSIDNQCRRKISNGIRLQDLEIWGLNMKNFYVNNILVSINIIDDMFDQLWKQYVELSKRPCGVSVNYGWKELIIPEYFICIEKNEENEFDIYRLDPITNDFMWNL